MRQAFFLGLALSVGYYIGHAAGKQEKLKQHAERCVSHKELQGCEETASDMLRASMNCEFEKDRCEIRWSACNESLNNKSSIDERRAE